MTPLPGLAFDDPNLLAAVAFVAVLATLAVGAGLWSAVFEGDRRRLQRRMERLGQPAAAPAEKDGAQKVESVRRQEAASSIKSLDRLLKGVLPNATVLRLRLERAGWTVKVGDYLLGCLVLAVLTALLVWAIYGLHPLLALLIGAGAGSGLPHFIVARQTQKRLRRFTSLLPDALELVTRGIKSGLPVSEAIHTIGEEVQDPVGGEFREISAQMKIGVPMDEALWSAAKRLSIPEFKFFVISLSIQQETGGNLAEVLEKLSEMVRRREQVRLKIKAMSSEARASAMIIGARPFIMGVLIYLVNPDYMIRLFTDPRGWLMLGFGLTSMAIGVAVMSKMIKFEI
jgi:tight adherence protein B